MSLDEILHGKFLPKPIPNLIVYMGIIAGHSYYQLKTTLNIFKYFVFIIQNLKKLCTIRLIFILKINNKYLELETVRKLNYIQLFK